MFGLKAVYDTLHLGSGAANDNEVIDIGEDNTGGVLEKAWVELVCFKSAANECLLEFFELKAGATEKPSRDL
jgi:hypothetical protein